jgi:stage V sporulation protein G
MSDRDEKLQAFCSVTFNDDFVVRDLKIITGSKGPFVAMPSRKLMDRCSRCGGKNHLRAKYCNDCGIKLNPNRAEKDRRGRARLHTDISHPINSKFREILQDKILKAFREEKIKAEQPGYVSPSLEEDYYDDELDDRPFEYDKETPTKEKTNNPRGEKEEKKTKLEDSFDAGIFS